MNAPSYEVYRELDPANKDAAWANKVVTIYRRDWRPFVNWDRYVQNISFLDSTQSLDQVKDSFKDKKFLSLIQFDPLGIMEAYKDALIEELTKNPPKAELKANDPTAVNEKEQDIQLLKNRKIVENDISATNKQVNLPPHKVSYDKFKGNVQEFDKMGLDENDPDDLNFYQQDIQRLNYEMGGQALINSIMKLSRFDLDLLSDLTRNILAVRAITVQTFVDKITGEIKVRYIYPQTAYGIFGKSKDGHDNICQGWQDNITVMEWLQQVGNDFEWERDWRQLLWAINYCQQGQNFTGFIRSTIEYNCCGNPVWLAEGGLPEKSESNLISWDIALTYKVSAGYIEFNTWEATQTYLKKKDDPNYVDMVPYSYDMTQHKQIKEYYKESYYQQQWYGSNFLTTSSITQYLFNFSKIYYQNLHGANDEYASGSMIFYQEQGLSAVEIAKPYIRIANFAFYRLLWVITKAKPESDVIVLEEMLQISKGLQKLYPQLTNSSGNELVQSIFQQYIKFREENFIELRAFPQIDGRTMPQLPALEKKHNGLDPIAAAMQVTVSWAEGQISQKIGINPMRIGANPPSRESNKSENETIAASINSTGYVYRMLQAVKDRIATRVLSYAQDIVKFRDSVPYKWLLTLIGNEAFDSIKALKDFCAHRFSMFVGDYNVDMQKDRIMQAADMSLAQKELKIDQWFYITQTDDPRAAIKLYTLAQMKHAKLERSQAVADQQSAQQSQMALLQMQLQIEKAKGQNTLAVAQKQVDGVMYSADQGAQSRVQVKQLGVEAEGDKQAAKAEGTIEVDKNKANTENQQAFPTI